MTQSDFTSFNENNNLDGYRIVEIWLEFHINADALYSSSGSATHDLDIYLIEKSERNYYRAVKDCDWKRWHSLCTGAGWTVYGAVALSWCEGAELSQVWEGWEASGFPLLPRPEYERPARFLNPDLLPQTDSLKELAKAANNKSLPLSAMIVAMGDRPLQFDLSDEQLKSANPQLSAFLMNKMKAQGDENPELIAHWSDKIKGTDYEV